MPLDFSNVRIPGNSGKDSGESKSTTPDELSNLDSSGGDDSSLVDVSLDSFVDDGESVVEGASSSWNPFLDESGGDSEVVGEASEEGLESVESGGGVVGKGGVPVEVEVPVDVSENARLKREFKGSGKSSGSVVSSKSKSGDVRLPGKTVSVLGSRVRSSGKSSGSGGSVRPGELWDEEVGGKSKRYGWVRDGGRLNAAELEFFGGLESSRSEALRGEGPVASLRAPAHLVESDSEREERLRRVSDAVFGRDAFRRGSKLRFGYKHFEMLEFLALFKYANSRQLCQLFSEAPVTSYKRLKLLRRLGLVEDRKLWGAEPVWYLTEVGQLLSGYDFPKFVAGSMSLAMVPHQFVVNHVAANLWRSHVNVLNDSEYPRRNRVDMVGREVFGERLASEFELQSSFSKLRLSSRADVYRRLIMDKVDRAFREWESAGGVDSGVESPEMVFGNEFMWVLYPPQSLKLSHHVPDLVVKRPRNGDGSPNSLAIEVELANKPIESYRRVLNAYRYDDRIFGQVVWVCKSKGAARKLNEVARENGLLASGRIKILPIITSEGVFKGKDLWTL